jgi:predicted nicotinamide N-methyase
MKWIFPYETEVQTLDFGAVSLQLERLKDIEATIDQVFEVLKKENRPELLEELCPYFGVPWTAAIGLTQFLAKELGALKEDAPLLLELGCGLAIPALLAAKQGARSIVTDFHPDVPKFLEKNRALNSIPAQMIRFAELNWTQGPLMPALAEPHWIIGSDILYERQHPEHICRAIIGNINTHTRRLLIADPARPYLQDFVNEMKKQIGKEPMIHVERCSIVHTGKDVIVLDYQL